MKWAVVLAVLLNVLIAPSAEAKTLGPAISEAVETIIIPGFTRFHSASRDMVQAITAYCKTPGDIPWRKVEDEFSRLVTDFGYIEPFKFGPGQDDNNFYRLFFWPDRRGRGLRQVQRIIAAKDPSVLEVASLRSKSVAVQGLGSLDFTLTQIGTAPNGPDADFLCRYAVANGSAIEETAHTMLSQWSGGDGYGQVMQAAGPGNPVYKSDKEAMQELLRAAKEQLLVARDMKLIAILGKSAQKAKPRRAPFWRSGTTLLMIRANLSAVKDVMTSDAIKELVGDGLADEALFEYSNAIRVFQATRLPSGRFEAMISDPRGRADLLYAVNPINGLVILAGERYPAAIGLTLGFNSLDGD